MSQKLLKFLIVPILLIGLNKASAQSDCCVANGTPGCDDSACEALICSQDPFCCNTAWDSFCAGAALSQCAVCAAPSFNPCSSIPNISACGTSVTGNWTTGQNGAWDPVVNSCGYPTPGQERIWTFTPTTSGIHQINVTSISGGWYDFFFKAASSGCNNSGWTCIQDVLSAGTYGSLNLTAGTQYYFLIDPEHTNTGSLTFNITCPAPSFNPCSSIPNISACGTSVTGNWTAGQNGAWTGLPCGFPTPGQERLWTFTPATSGIHQINVTSISGGWYDFFFKAASSGCNNSGWTCIQDVLFAGTYGSLNLTAGTQYYFLIDPEHTNTGSVTFNITCPAPSCAVTPPACVQTGSPCYSQVITNDPFCCNVEWDMVCQNAYNACNSSCLCTVTPPACVNTNTICYYTTISNDPFCCGSGWDGLCQAAYDTCNPSCLGCTDPSACNYNPLAQTNDGSCTYPGCTNPSACNYNPTAGCDNGSCTFAPGVPGCVDLNSACYLQVIQNDPFCCNNTWDSVCQNSYNICNPATSCLGCTDSAACNYSSVAVTDNGTCIYPGCTNSSACNYNPSAGCDDGSCHFLFGCTNPAACNYDPTAVCDDGTCNTAPPVILSTSPSPLECVGGQTLQIFGGNFCNVSSVTIDGNPVTITLLDPNQQYIEVTTPAGTGTDLLLTVNTSNGPASQFVSYAAPTITGISMSSLACTGGETVTITGVNFCDINLVTFGSLSAAIQSVSATSVTVTTPGGLDGLHELYVESPSGGSNLIFVDYYGWGCTNPTACNYDPSAACDDGSCHFLFGCTDAAACNYDPTAICDDGTCNNGAPVITSTSPAQLHCLGGQTLQIFGSNFCNVSSVTIDGNPVTITLLDPNQQYIEVIAPAGTGTDLLLTVNTSNGPASQFVSYAAPTIAGISLGSLACTGGETVTINGVNFCDVNLVMFGSQSASIQSVSATSVTVTTPGGLDGLQELYVESPSGGSNLIFVDYYGWGCTDGAACNYDPAALCDDGSCHFLFGCTDDTACNYDPTAVCDDNSCHFLFGCTDAAACNYDPSAVCDDNSCHFLFGCTDSAACNYDPFAVCDDNSCHFLFGCTDAAACNYDPSAICDDGSCHFLFGCTVSTACNYDPSAVCDDGSCDFISCADCPGGVWASQTPGTDESLWGISFASSTHGWAVGADGRILRTTNGGASWTTQDAGTFEWLTDVHAVSNNQAWAVGTGGLILHTNDGGSTWDYQDSGLLFNSLLGVHFVNASLGWAVGSGGAIRTTNDGGATWTGQSSGTTQALYAVHFSSVTNGVAVGENGTIRTTTNGGATWTSVSSPTSETLTGVHFIGNDGWISGEGGSVLFSNNGGASWSVQYADAGRSFNDVFFTSPQHGRCVGAAGDVLYTNDGGATWALETSDTGQDLYAAAFSSPTNGWAAGGNIFGGSSVIVAFSCPDVVFGCTDPAACNYDPQAEEDDDSCGYPGCYDPFATNYDPFALCGGGFCMYAPEPEPLVVGVGGACTPVAGNTVLGGDSGLPPGPGGSADPDDEVFYFVNLTCPGALKIRVDGVDIDPVVELWTADYQLIDAANDNSGIGSSEVLYVDGLSVGSYLVRVYNFGSGVAGSFTICASGLCSSAVDQSYTALEYGVCDVTKAKFVPSAIGYDWVFVHTVDQTTLTYTQPTNNTWLPLSNLTGGLLEYGASYEVSVGARFNDPDLGVVTVFGSQTDILTMKAAPSTQLATSDIGGTFQLSQAIKAAQSCAADGYAFSLTPDGGDALETVYMFGGTVLPLCNVPGILPGTTYTVSIAVIYDGTEYPFGTSHTIQTAPYQPVQLRAQDDCGVVGAVSLNYTIWTNAFRHCAKDYTWEFTPLGPGLPIYYKKGSGVRNLKLSDVPGLVPGESYTVRVKAEYGNYTGDNPLTGEPQYDFATAYGTAGTVCLLGPAKLPSMPQADESDEDTTMQSSLTLFPVPTSGMLNISAMLPAETHTANLTIYDLSGRVVMMDVFSAAEGEFFQTVDVGSKLATGIYVLTLRAGDVLWTERISVVK